MKMDMTLNKEKLNDKELFERKKLPETSIHLDEWLRENALEFYEARAKQDFQESEN